MIKDDKDMIYAKTFPIKDGHDGRPNDLKKNLPNIFDNYVN
jgi:hypothetical protein